MILSALEDSLWIQKDAARLLGISPRALNYRVKKLGILSPPLAKEQIRKSERIAERPFAFWHKSNSA